MINILFSDSCRTAFWGGVEKWITTLGEELNKQNYNVHLICRPHSLLGERAQSVGLAVHHATFKNSLDITTTLKILSLIRKQKINVIICAKNLDTKLAGLAGKIAGIPVISRQGLAIIPDNWKYRFLVKHFTTSMITNTITIKQQYENYSWFPKDHIQVIYNGVTQPQETTNKENIREKYGISPEEKLIFSAGRISNQKGFIYLIEAARMAQEQHLPWKFLLLGEGEERPHLLQLIEHYELKNIQLPGFQTNMEDFYRAADLFVLSSLSEGTPNVVLEAMLYGCPVVATNVNGVQEVIDNGIDGWIIPPKDSGAIFHTINENINNLERLAEVSLHAKKKIQEKFTMEQSVKHFSAYIDHILHPVKKVIIRTPNFLGDTINTTPCIQLVKQEYPDAKLIIVGPDFVRDIFKYEERVSRFITFPLNRKKNITTFFHLLKAIHTEKGDLGIIFVNTFVSALQFKLAGVKRSIGYSLEKRSALLDFSLPLNRNKHYINRYANLFNEYLGNKYIYLPDLYLPVSGKKTFHFDNNRPTIGFYPGGKHKGYRAYPQDYAIQLIRGLNHQGFNVILLGDQQDAPEQSRYISEVRGDNIINLAGQTDIEEFFNTINHLDLLITIDSAAMHAAAALHTPFIALMGLSTSPTSTIVPKVPFGKILKIENNLIREEDYIRNLTPDIVLHAVQEILPSNSANRS